MLNKINYNMMNTKWYVIKVASSKEKKIKDSIEQELKRNSAENIISKLLIPFRKEIQIRNGKKVHIDKNFFPGYIFVECESINEVESHIKHISGVASILKQPLTQIEINRIFDIENKNENPDELSIDQKVKIIDGPFNSFSGIIKSLDMNRQKSKVSVTVFGREVMLDLSFSQFTKIY
jgi:transcription termination/antitermination protein NusG